MICEDAKNEPIGQITAPCETLTCLRCGCLYPSRGKSDPGYCRICESVIKPLNGGPLNGSSVYHTDEHQHSGLLEDD